MDILSERPRLLGLAYRLLGSLSDAEDVVQEAYGRWYALTDPGRAAIESPGAWLTTVASRICLDLLGSARARRERYVGSWLPEPVPDDAGLTDPADRVALDETVTMAFLVVLESMTPAERVAFVLHDVFGYPFAEVADVLGRSPAAARQLASSARRRVRSAPASRDRSADVVRAFKRAWAANDIEGLVGLLDPDATATADGGGLVSTAPEPITGAARIARYAVEITQLVPAMDIEERLVNGVPGLVAVRDGVVITVMAFDVVGDVIRNVWAVRNPEKLRAWVTSPSRRRPAARHP